MLQSLVLLFAAVVVWRLVVLQRSLGRYALVRRERKGWHSVELRRLSTNARLPHDSQPYPQPREFRVRCQRVVGIPVWRSECVVGLPLSTDAHVHRLAAADYDHLFKPEFSCHG